MNRTVLYLLIGIALSILLTLVIPGFFVLIPLVFLPLAFRKSSKDAG